MTSPRDEPTDPRAMVRAASRDLRPGLYLQAGPQFWRRVGAPPTPSHVSRTKGSRINGMSGGRAITMLRSLAGLRHSFIIARGSGTAELAIAAFDGGMVLIAPREGVVRRTYGTTIADEQYLAWREAFVRHVAAPQFRVADDGRTIVEEFVAGEYLLDLAVQDRVEVIRRLLRAYASLTRAEAVSAPVARHADALASAVRRSAPTALRDMWEATDTRWLQRADTIWVPSAYEANAKNLVVRQDGSPSPIDLGDLRPEPFFSYPIGVMVSAGAAVGKDFLEGGLDTEVDELFASAGVRWERTIDQRRGLLLVRMVHAALCDDASGAETLESSLSRRWTEMQFLLGGAVEHSS